MFRKLLPLDDLRAFLDSRSRHQLWAAGLAIGITLLVMTGFLIENRTGYMKRDPILVYVQSWPDNRSVADVKAVQAVELAARKAAIARRDAAKAEPKG